MERKNIGGFIAALRKANGMTQRELAERLNVSDKTVSRWERGGGDPELSLVPVIAEIFGVTCDELLRGERRPQGEPSGGEASPRGEKQRQRLLASGLTRYKNRTYIAMGISTAGLIAALIGNLAFYSAVIGALLGAVFFVVSVVCQAVFVNQAFLSVVDAGDEADIGHFRYSVIRLALRALALTVAFAGFTFPLLLVEAYVGLGPDNMLLFGGIGAACFLAVYAVVCWFISARLLRKGVFSLDERAEEVYWHKHRLKKRVALVLAAVMAVTLAAQLLLNTVGYGLFVRGIRFTDYESFVSCMESGHYYRSIYLEDMEETAYRREDVGNITYYYDEAGNLIGEWEFPVETLRDSEGNVLCEYVLRNEAVVAVQYGEESDGLLPITVITRDDYDRANSRANIMNACFIAAYCLELLTAVMVYVKKRAQ